jgi:hypothetical protein
VTTPALGVNLVEALPVGVVDRRRDEAAAAQEDGDAGPWISEGQLLACP